VVRQVIAMPALQLVIFDCDGVLVDSETITGRIFHEMLAEAGIQISVEDMFEKFMGRSMPQCIEIMQAMLGHEVPQALLQEYQRRIEAAWKAELQPVPGIEAALDALRIPYCVASSGTPEKMRMTLGLTGLLPRFEGRMFSVTQVARSKPAPDVFLLAASTLQVPPSACAVIEDTPTGVTAGVAANMQVYGYCAHTPAQRLLDAGAHHVFKAMSELPALLRN
jgi:HAD superfamily hydrolase (TIGR01509 family)